MFLYYTKLAFKSLLRTPLVSLLSLVAIALGIAVPTTVIAIHEVFAQDPIPSKSDRLFNVRMDSWTANSEFFDIRPGDPPKHVTYRDMAGLMESEIPEYRTGVGNAAINVFPEDEAIPPRRVSVRLCHADFFAMFEAPFAFGAGWTREADRRRERVVVLSERANTRLFGGEDSVGRSVRLGTTDFSVIGVLAPWQPTPQYYDILNTTIGRTRDYFVPFDTIRDQSVGLSRTGQADNWGSALPADSPDAEYTLSERTWIQYWVELEPGDVQRYRDHVDAYTAAQRASGRFPRPQNNRVTPLMEWMEVREVVPPMAEALSIISLLFLSVCALNLTGLLLGKFLSTSALIGVHRALGASRTSIFLQRLLECELIGLTGGVVGVVLAMLGLRVVAAWVPGLSLVAGFGMDAGMLAVATGLSLAAGLLSGMYPAWRACRVAPAVQLKLQ